VAHEIYLYGTVGGVFWDEEFFTPSSVAEMLAGLTGDLTVRINSGGGIASDGQAIYNILRDYPGRVNVVVDGVAASAASLIVMAGETITMRAGAILMIHDPACMFTEGRGTEQDHLKAAAGLAVISSAFAKVYASRAGISVAEAREIMRTETYYDGEAAVAAGFATTTDDETQSAAVARFDYGIYPNAPDNLRAAGATIPQRKSRPAVLAMMAGIPAPKPKESSMPNPTMEDQREDMSEDDETTADADDAEMVEEDGEDTVEAADDGASGDTEDDDEDAEASGAVAILDLCMACNRPEGEARDMISRGLTLPQAVAEITANRTKENPVNGTRRGAPTARILRDERTTRRQSMAVAIAAQLTQASDVPAQARPFMDLSLAEMAAQCIGHRGPIRNAGQRLQIFEMASHSTSDFPGIFENALNKVLLERYQLAEPTYRQISRRRDFTDFRVHPQVRAGDFPKLKPIGEGGEIKHGTFGEQRETAILSSYGVALTITRQMMINDELGAIDDVLSDYGQMIADFEEETFYAFALSAELSDGNPVFHTSHKNLAASGGAISVATVATGRAAIRKQTSIDGKKLNMAPSILLVGPDKETEAEQLVAQIQPQEAGNVNPFAGRLTPVTTAQITDNSWYLLTGADRPGGALWVHGFLTGAAAPRIRTEEPFGKQGMSMSVEHDFGLGAVDFRGGWKNPGA